MNNSVDQLFREANGRLATENSHVFQVPEILLMCSHVPTSDS
jgi:hypothetical protein